MVLAAGRLYGVRTVAAEVDGLVERVWSFIAHDFDQAMARAERLTRERGGADESELVQCHLPYDVDEVHPRSNIAFLDALLLLETRYPLHGRDIEAVLEERFGLGGPDDLYDADDLYDPEDPQEPDNLNGPFNRNETAPSPARNVPREFDVTRSSSGHASESVARGELLVGLPAFAVRLIWRFDEWWYVETVFVVRAESSGEAIAAVRGSLGTQYKDEVPRVVDIEAVAGDGHAGLERGEPIVVFKRRHRNDPLHPRARDRREVCIAVCGHEVDGTLPANNPPDRARLESTPGTGAAAVLHVDVWLYGVRVLAAVGATVVEYLWTFLAPTGDEASTRAETATLAAAPAAQVLVTQADLPYAPSDFPDELVGAAASLDGALIGRTTLPDATAPWVDPGAAEPDGARSSSTEPQSVPSPKSQGTTSLYGVREINDWSQGNFHEMAFVLRADSIDDALRAYNAHYPSDSDDVVAVSQIPDIPGFAQVLIEPIWVFTYVHTGDPRPHWWPTRTASQRDGRAPIVTL